MPMKAGWGNRKKEEDSQQSSNESLNLEDLSFLTEVLLKDSFLKEVSATQLPRCTCNSQLRR